MGSQSLRIVMVLGVLVTLVGGTGIFAAFTDRATTGANTVTTGPRPHAADIRISPASVVGGMVTCDAALESENLTTGLFEVAAFQPGSAAEPAYVCIKNVGSAAVGLTASVIDLIDTDPECTGDEAEAGDATCGGSQAGELAAVVWVQIEQALTCDTSQAELVGANFLANWIANPVGFPVALPPGNVSCLRFDVIYSSGTPEASVQLAQSDLVQWRFAFDASVSE